MTETPWYHEFFGQRYLDSYLPLLTSERTIQEVDSIERILAMPPSSKILDLCCGHGRQLIELASRGYQMTGLDLDPLFLGIAKEEAERRGLQVRLEHRDMRDIPFSEEFEALTNMFTSFGYLEDDEEDQKVLNRIVKALKSGGLFLMEIMSRDILVRIFESRGWYKTETGVYVLDERSFDFLAGRNNVRQVTIYPDGTKREAYHSWRAYTLTELAKMLERAGLKVAATYGGMDGSLYTLESHRLVILARKR